ncbi:hypothetical protein JCM10207_001518 [Rhodosporidiobolus poonsookiae]
MSAKHPLAPHVLPACKRFPHQASSLFQAFVDLSLAQQWRDLEVVELEECSCAILRGRPKEPRKAPPAIVLPMGLTTPTSLSALTAVLQAVATRYPSSSPSPADASSAPLPPSTKSEDDPTTVYLAMVEKDASIVYYVLRKGIISPKEVPE